MEQALPQLIRFGQEVCSDLAQAEHREWWISNGLGSYAAGTIAGTPTQSYHGLLIAPNSPPFQPVVTFARADATLAAGQQRWPLSTQSLEDERVEPQEHPQIESFHLDGRMPVWCYAIGERRIEKRIWMQPGANTTCIAYRFLSGHAEMEEISLWVSLWVKVRYASEHSRKNSMAPVIQANQTKLELFMGESRPLRFLTRCGVMHPERTWFKPVSLSDKDGRNPSDQHNLICVGQVKLPLSTGEWVGFVATLEEEPPLYYAEALEHRQRHDRQLLKRTKIQSAECLRAPPWIDQLILAADSFLIDQSLPQTPDTKSINGGRSCASFARDTCASLHGGYPWFSDCVRTIMIALPGLALYTHRYKQARDILVSYASFIDGGRFSSDFAEKETLPRCNRAEALLWYIEAWCAYVIASGDSISLREHFPILKGIIDAFKDGSQQGVGADPQDGLLRKGEAGAQSIWQDVKQGNRVLIGKPVELNALWYNALMTMAELAKLNGMEPNPYTTLAVRAGDSFQRYLMDDGRGLMDLIDGPDGNDPSLRLHQILAVSLPYSPLDPTDQTDVVESVGSALSTTHELLSQESQYSNNQLPDVADVKRREHGLQPDPDDDWLLGHYALSVYRVTGDASLAQSKLTALRDHLLDVDPNNISKVFNNASPQQPLGLLQAATVASTLAAWCRLEHAKSEVG
ncbi:MAG: amylo-alpha-1,6-glucosidase [Pseudomonadota bacterium]